MKSRERERETMDKYLLTNCMKTFFGSVVPILRSNFAHMSFAQIHNNQSLPKPSCVFDIHCAYMCVLSAMLKVSNISVIMREGSKSLAFSSSRKWEM